MNNSSIKLLLTIEQCFAKARLADFEMLKRLMHKGDDVTLRELTGDDEFYLIALAVDSSFGLLGMVMPFLYCSIKVRASWLVLLSMMQR